MIAECLCVIGAVSQNSRTRSGENHNIEHTILYIIDAESIIARYCMFCIWFIQPTPAKLSIPPMQIIHNSYPAHKELLLLLQFQTCGVCTYCRLHIKWHNAFVRSLMEHKAPSNSMQCYKKNNNPRQRICAWPQSEELLCRTAHISIIYISINSLHWTYSRLWGVCNIFDWVMCCVYIPGHEMHDQSTRSHTLILIYLTTLCAFVQLLGLIFLSFNLEYITHHGDVILFKSPYGFNIYAHPKERSALENSLVQHAITDATRRNYCTRKFNELVVF